MYGRPGRPSPSCRKHQLIGVPIHDFLKESGREAPAGAPQTTVLVLVLVLVLVRVVILVLVLY